MNQKETGEIQQIAPTRKAPKKDFGQLTVLDTDS